MSKKTVKFNFHEEIINSVVPNMIRAKTFGEFTYPHDASARELSEEFSGIFIVRDKVLKNCSGFFVFSELIF